MLTIFAVLQLTIVWRGDLPAAPESVARDEMRSVASLHFMKIRFMGGSGVQLSDRWILTACHAADAWKPEQIQVRLGEHRAPVARIVLHPNETVDLALLELAKPIPLAHPLTLANHPAKPGARLWLGGFGKHGPADAAGKAGVFTAGHNRLEKIDGKRGKIVFDPPGERAEPTEVLPTRFDSGSPVFVENDSNWLLFGITVTASNSKNPGYGDRSHHQLLGPEREWLDANLRGIKWSP